MKQQTAIETSQLILDTPQRIDQNPAAVYIASLPAATGKRTQAQALHVIARIFGADVNCLNWGALRYQHTAAVRAKLAEAYAPATANKILSALRQTIKHAWLLGQMGPDEYGKAINLKPITGETLPAGRELSQGEILALINTCQDDETPAGTRDAAIIGLMYGAGLRRAEVVSLTLESFDIETGELTLTGKRNKQRKAYITNGALEALCDWLDIRGLAAGALFVEVDKGGNVLTQRNEITVKQSRRKGGAIVANKKAGMTIYRGGAMTSQAIYNMLIKRAQQANVKQFSPHDMRRTFVSDLLDKGADIATVAKMAGHANVQTTARYDRRPEEAKRKAANLLHVPYRSKARA